MSKNAIKGIVENGLIRLQEGVILSEQTKVFVIVDEAPKPHIHSPHFVPPKQSADFRKQIVGIPADAKL